MLTFRFLFLFCGNKVTTVHNTMRKVGGHVKWCVKKIAELEVVYFVYAMQQCESLVQLSLEMSSFFPIFVKYVIHMLLCFGIMIKYNVIYSTVYVCVSASRE